MEHTQQPAAGVFKFVKDDDGRELLAIELNTKDHRFIEHYNAVYRTVAPRVREMVFPEPYQESACPYKEKLLRFLNGFVYYAGRREDGSLDRSRLYLSADDMVLLITPSFVTLTHHEGGVAREESYGSLFSALDRLVHMHL
jgi:hypothetical protein